MNLLYIQLHDIMSEAAFLEQIYNTKHISIDVIEAEHRIEFNHLLKYYIREYKIPHGQFNLKDFCHWLLKVLPEV